MAAGVLAELEEKSSEQPQPASVPEGFDLVGEHSALLVLSASASADDISGILRTYAYFELADAIHHWNLLSMHVR